MSMIEVRGRCDRGPCLGTLEAGIKVLAELILTWRFWKDPLQGALRFLRWSQD